MLKRKLYLAFFTTSTVYWCYSISPKYTPSNGPSHKRSERFFPSPKKKKALLLFCMTTITDFTHTHTRIIFRKTENFVSLPSLHPMKGHKHVNELGIFISHGEHTLSVIFTWLLSLFVTKICMAYSTKTRAGIPLFTFLTNGIWKAVKIRKE